MQVQESGPRPRADISCTSWGALPAGNVPKGMCESRFSRETETAEDTHIYLYWVFPKPPCQGASQGQNQSDLLSTQLLITTPQKIHRQEEEQSEGSNELEDIDLHLLLKTESQDSLGGRKNLPR